MDRPDPLRKTLAIVFCDIVAFSRLIAKEGDLVAATILRDFCEHTGRLSKDYHCLTLKFIGDAFLGTFEKIDDALPFVGSIQNLLTDNPTLSGQHLAFTFSLHYGDVLYIETSYGADVLGEDVNIAAHLNELAQPHQIVVSQAALDRLPSDQQSRAGPKESRQVKRAGTVEFRRITLAAP